MAVEGWHVVRRVWFALLIGAERLNVHRSREAWLGVPRSQRGRAWPRGAAVVLWWLAWFNGARWPRLVARTGCAS
jgi:hypothetical protein